MKRWFTFICLTLALVASAPGCRRGKQSLRSTKKPVVAQPIASAEAPPAPLAPPAPVLPAPAPPVAVNAPGAAPAGTAGAGGASGNGMAVIIVMLPGTDAARAPGTAASGVPRTYKLSLSANADTATIQVDGQPSVTAPVQRLYPSVAAAPRLATAPARPRYAVPPQAAPVGIAPEATMELGEARARQVRRAAISTTMRPPLPPPIMNPNGAPIID